MVIKTYPPAKSIPKPPGGGTFTRWDKLVLHTTETSGLPAYPTFAPHLTYNPWSHTWYQHIPLDRSATTLADSSSTAVRENRDNAVQVEIVAYCDPPKNTPGKGVDHLDDRAVKELGAFAAWLNKNGGLRLRLASGWLPYPRSYGNTKNRMSGAEYDAFTGICGHEHVSSNDHGDPGDPPWLDNLLRYAQGGAAGSTPTPEGIKDMTQDLPYTVAPKQKLKKGRNEINLDSKPNPSKTVVVGPNPGVDARAAIEVADSAGKCVTGLGGYRAYWSIVSFKAGTPTTVSHNRKPTSGDVVLWAGDISKLADGRSPRLRLVVDTAADGLTLNFAEITGWTL